MPIISGSTVIRGSRGTPVAQDADDKLITVIQGSQGNAVAQDVNDRLIAMMYGSAGTPIAQDAANKLISIMQGSQGAAVAQDAANKLISVMQGSLGTAVLQDANNRLITAIVGSTGNPISQDAGDNLIAMMYGSEGTPVAQDANDYLITVIKGLYNGNLETVALDQDHAIKAVLYDPVDDWNKTQTIGLNELASRLGAIQGYDNRGRLLWADNFESSKLRWNIAEVGGAIVALSNEYAWSGESSVKFVNNGANTTGTIWRRFYHPLTGVFGIEATWSCSITLWSSLKFGLIIYDGTYRWNYYLKLSGLQRTFFMREQGYGSRNVGTMTCEMSDRNMWHKWKIVADTVNGKIPRVMVDGIEYDPSQYDVERIADTTCPHIYAFAEVNNQDIWDMDLFVDNVVFTHLEPVN